MAQAGEPRVADLGSWDSLYVDGEWVQPDDAGSLAVTNPYSGDTLYELPAATTETVDRAYEVAERAQEEWEKAPLQERAGVVTAALEALHEYHDDIVPLICQETGGVLPKAGTEIHLTEAMMQMATRQAFEAGGDHEGSTIPGRENLVERNPVGVVGIISPWNFPFNLSMRAVAPAIALGNSVVLKPAPQTPVIGGLLIAKLFEEAGLPAGVLNVVVGHDDEIGDHVAGHPIPSVMSFTGSTEIGKRVARNAVAELTRPALELGGNNPYIVTEDADLDLALEAAAFGTFTHQGQICISINRHIVHESLYDDYVGALTEIASSLPTGDPLDEDTVIGPLINENQRDQVLSFIEETVDAGATLECGGDADGLVVEPTVLSDVTNDMAAACNEHFGPVAPVIPFSDDEEAIEIANDTDMGLAAGVMSEDLGRARTIADEIEAGMVHINDQTINDEPHIPFGGVKQSGMGRYNADAIVDEFTETKWISIQHDARDYPV